MAQNYAPPGGPPPQNPNYTVVNIMPSVTIMTSRDSQRTTCPMCRADVTTTVRYEIGMGTHLAAVLLLFSFFATCGCFLIAYCVDTCKDAEHYCPACGAHIGTRRCLN